jgi:predicted acyltransferase
LSATVARAENVSERKPPRTEPPPSASTPSRSQRERLLSLDVFRGLTVAGMLLVNNPGSWGAIYPPLEHATWNGWTPTDLIFPFFLFIAGITTELSLSARRARGDDTGAIARQILKRGALIFLFGLTLSAFPFFQWGTVPGISDPSILDRVAYRVEHLRIMGVLQRIGVAYTLAALLTLRTTLKQQVMILAALLYGYWFAMTLLPVPGAHGEIGFNLLDSPSQVLSAWVDRTVLGVNHLWVGGVNWDPEGLLSTIPAVGTAMLGIFAGRWIGQRERPIFERLSGLFAAGALGMMFGLMWHWSFPINKSLWTSSYVLFTGGMACVALATCMWLIDVHQVKWWTKPFAVYGMNPMIAFLGSGLMARLIYSIWKVQYEGKWTSVQAVVYRELFLSWLSPLNASLAFALTFVLFWFGILYALYRRNFVFKV